LLQSYHFAILGLQLKGTKPLARSITVIDKLTASASETWLRESRNRQITNLFGPQSIGLRCRVELAGNQLK
jgi:hypothetical protein